MDIRKNKKQKTRTGRPFNGTFENLTFSEKFTILCEFMSITSYASVNIPTKVFLLAITLLNSSAASERADNVVDTVVIDAGHGGHDPGTRGKKVKEKDIALKIAMKLGTYIEKGLLDVKVIYTRKNDRYLALDERADIANKNKADLFICIHANAIVSTKAYGTETYVMGLSKENGNFEIAKRENSVILLDENHEERYEGFDPSSPESYILFSLTQSAYQENSLKFAQKVEEQFKNKVGRTSRGVKQAGFMVLWLTTMPSVLIETGFLSYPKEEDFLMSDKGQDLIASGIFRALKEYKLQLESVN